MSQSGTYLQARITLAEDMAETLSEALMDGNALSVAIEDAYAGTENEQPIFGEPGHPTDALWADSQIVCLFSAEANVTAEIAAACEQIKLPMVDFELEQIDDQNWVRLTQSQFDPIQISEQMWIVPSWHDKPDASDAIILELDPGLAFGTGSHPTTRLCLLWLEQNIRAGQTVLDYGCGSGILAIAAAKLGASDIFGVDVDEQAIIASKDNASKNQKNQIKFFLPDQMPEMKFDVLVANILANPLRMLGQMLAARVKTGGKIALSGILQEQAQELSELYSQWFAMEEPVFQEGWTLLSGTRK